VSRRQIAKKNAHPQRAETVKTLTAMMLYALRRNATITSVSGLCEAGVSRLPGPAGNGTITCNFRIATYMACKRSVMSGMEARHGAHRDFISSSAR
jgi:hypothetical protein